MRYCGDLGGTSIAFGVPNRDSPRTAPGQYVENHVENDLKKTVESVAGVSERPPPDARGGGSRPESVHSRWARRPRLAPSIRCRPVVLSLVLVAVVFAVDLSLPLGVAAAVPYTFAVLLALAARPAWFGPAVAGLCMLLTLAKLELVPERGTTEMWKVVVNRCLALFAIGMTTLLGVLRRRAEADRRAAEERAREHQAALAHMGRLSLLGQVTAGLAHELNQPLAAVCLQADLAARLAEPGRPVGAELAEALAEIAGQATRAAGIVKGIRRLARRADPCRDTVDVNDAVRTVVGLLDWRVRRAGATVELDLAAELPPTLGDRVLIEQVVFNLIQNAVDAVEPGKSARRVAVETALAPEGLRVSVRDSGPGLAEPAKVFEPFYTTKPDGMGLGLAVSRTIIDAHGGRLSGANTSDGGAMFSFTLPVTREEES